MPRLQDRLASLERRHAPPAPPPPVAYVDPQRLLAEHDRLVAEHPGMVAMLPAILPVVEWEAFAIEQQTMSAATARERVRALDADTVPAEVIPDNVLPMTR